LILHYPGGHFDFAKGHLEEGETELQAAVRELQEETSVTPEKIFREFQEEIYYSFHRRDILVKKTVTFFLARTASPRVKISHEHKGYLWLDYEESLTKITFENARGILRKAESFLINSKDS
jgi:8-oxo-dGTP pyrophosphatase MutT (NUDIX family)